MINVNKTFTAFARMIEHEKHITDRGGSRTVAISKMELIIIIVNGLQPLTFIAKCSGLDVAAVLDPTLIDNRAKFLRILMIHSLFRKKFEDKVSTSHEKVHENTFILNEKLQGAEK